MNTGTHDAQRAAVVCHPHPLHGGTMHNKVVFAAMKALHALGYPVLRFNFRGAGLSEGKHDQGRGEVEDVRAGLDWLQAEFHLPIVFAGFSFGAVTGLRACCDDPRVVALIALGAPVSVSIPGQVRPYSYGFLSSCVKPKLFVSGTRDQYGPRLQLQEVFDSLPAPKKMVWVQNGDHFFQGRLDQVRAAIEHWTGAL